MITPQERIRNGFSEIFRLTREVIPSHNGQRKNTPTPASQKSQTRTLKPPSDLVAALNISSSLQFYIDQADTFAPYSILLGKCEDGLPLTMELSNPAPGSLLITGDEACGKHFLLESILKSGILLNYPDRLQCTLIAEEGNPFTSLRESNLCREFTFAEADTLTRVIGELGRLSEARRRSPLSDPVLILAIDKLDLLMDTLDEKTTGDLFKLIRHGPRSRIWTFATIHTSMYSRVHYRIIEAFKSQVFGKISSVRLASSVTGDDRAPALELISGSQFCIPAGEDWLKFWVCE